MTPERLDALAKFDFPSPSHARAVVAELVAQVRKLQDAGSRCATQRDAARAALRAYIDEHAAENDDGTGTWIAIPCECGRCLAARAALGETP